MARASSSVASSTVPFNKPYVTGAEFDYIQEAIDNAHLAGSGPFSRRCSDYLKERLGAQSVLLTHSCTGALEMAALLADVQPGDEVILPSFTFTSTATAFALRGAVPVFVDVREDTLNLDESLVEAAITPRTRALVAAQGFCSDYHGAPLGSLGSLGTLSFHETKNVISGEGGALVVNDPALVERAEVLHEKGTNRRAFFRGQVDKYSWVDLGSSFVASELAAAFLWAQLEQDDWITGQRMAIWERYHDGFAELQASGRVRRPIVPRGAGHNAHMYYLLLETMDARDRAIEDLAELGVAAVFHYVPLHSAPAGRRLGRAVGTLSVTDDVSGRLLRLPLWVGMTDQQVERVIAAVWQIARR
jgi:dTDP-4-amino-4,6-dideoxygalactose transaminase